MMVQWAHSDASPRPASCGWSVLAVYLDKQDVDAMDWSACSKNLNPIRHRLDIPYRSIQTVSPDLSVEGADLANHVRILPRR